MTLRDQHSQNATRALPGASLGSHRSPEDNFMEIVVHYVDVVNFTCDGLTADSRTAQGVHYPEIQLNRSGEIRHPACGDRIVVRQGPGNVLSYVCHATRIEGLDDKSRPTFAYLKDPVDHQYLKVKALPGDRHWFVNSAFFSMLRGGIVRLGASPLCQFTMMKWENAWRLISQNWEFYSTGVNADSVNTKGKVSSRFGFFRKDSWGKSFKKDWPDRSDFHITVNNDGITILGGEVTEGEWIRHNTLKVQIFPNGGIKLSQGKLSDENHSRQIIELGPYGDSFEHSMFAPGETKADYYEQITVLKAGMARRVVQMSGTYEVNADAIAFHAADGSVKMDAKQIDIGTEANASNITVNGSKFTGNVPINGWDV